MSKQTAVNFLRGEAIKLVVQAMQGTLNEDTLEYQISEIVTKALEMEREQMRKTYSHGWTTRERFDDLVRDIIYPLGLDYEEKQEYAFQQYYEQTYGGQDE